MANVTEGLSKPEAGEDVNTSAGFDAALAGKGIARTEADGESSDTSVASGLVEIESGQQARDPASGKFVAKETSPPAAAGTSEETAAPSDDPDVLAYLARYGNDPAAALKAAANAQSLIGRQGNELGQTREELAELRGRLDALTSLQTAAAAGPALTDSQVDDRAQSEIQGKGFFTAATEAANLAHTTGDERQLRSVFELWNLEEPFNAQGFIADFRAWQRTEGTAPAPAADPWVETQKSQAGINSTIEALSVELGDRWATVGPLMMTALESAPKVVQEMIGSPDPAVRLEGARIVADRATVISGTAVPTPEAAGLSESVARKLAGSSVATGALRPASAATGETPSTREDEIAAFKRAIVEVETTSVASGLTYGK